MATPLKPGDPVRWMADDTPMSGTVKTVLTHMAWVEDMTGEERLVSRKRLVLDHARQFLLDSADQPKHAGETP